MHATRFAVSIVSPPGYPHSAAFHEVAETLHHGLCALGHDCVVTDDTAPAGRRPIVLGSNLLPTTRQPLAPDAILYNLEQLDAGSSWLGPELVELFRTHEVWEYDERNAGHYPAFGLSPPRVVPVGYVPALTRIAPAEEDIDVLFYGSVNPRRRRILDALRQRGLRVEEAFGVYGEARDRLIARSRLVLNLHYYDAKVFEMVRVSYLLANRRCVVSERGTDGAEEQALEDGVAFAAYDELVETCARLAGDPAARARIAARGFELISARDEVAILRRALAGPAEGARAASLHYYGHARPEIVALARPGGRRVLDVGCAAGAMGAALRAAGAAEVVGIEVHPEAAAAARTRLRAVFCLDVETSPGLPYPDGYFDVITFADVLEHLRDPWSVLRHLRRWLADDGRIVCSIPNVRHQSVLLPLLAAGQWDYVEAGVLDRTHLRFFTPASARRLLEACGYRVESPVQAVVTPASPALDVIGSAVAALQGDADSFREEARVVQVLLSARPASRHAERAASLDDLWSGSHPTKLLVAPDPREEAWRQGLPAFVAGLGRRTDTTVGVALPLALCQEPPEPVRRAAEAAQVDLLLIEAPADDLGWQRLVAGASAVVSTSPTDPLETLALRVGVEVLRALATGPAAPAARERRPPGDGAGSRHRYLDLVKRCTGDLRLYDGVSALERDAVMGRSGGAGRAQAASERLAPTEAVIERVLCENVAGDLLEVGASRGGSAVLMRAMLEVEDVRDRRVWVANAPECREEPDADLDELLVRVFEGKLQGDEASRLAGFPDAPVPVERLRDAFARHGLLDEQVGFLDGPLDAALREAGVDRLAAARIDCATPGATLEALKAVASRLSAGGQVLVQDHGVFPAVRRAAEEFLRDRAAGDDVEVLEGVGLRSRRRA